MAAFELLRKLAATVPDAETRHHSTHSPVGKALPGLIVPVVSAPETAKVSTRLSPAAKEARSKAIVARTTA